VAARTLAGGRGVQRCHLCQAASRLGSGKRCSSGHIGSRHARRCHLPASTCRTRDYEARCLSPRPTSSALEPLRKPYLRQAAHALRPKRSSVRSIMDFAAPTSAGRMERSAASLCHRPISGKKQLKEAAAKKPAGRRRRSGLVLETPGDARWTLLRGAREPVEDGQSAPRRSRKISNHSTSDDCPSQGARREGERPKIARMRRGTPTYPRDAGSVDARRYCGV
jgi:hypothetical protein